MTTVTRCVMMVLLFLCACAPRSQLTTTEAQPVAPATPAQRGTPSAQQAGVPGILRVALPYEPGTVDPQQASFSDEITVALLNYQPLMRFNTDMEPIPGAAERVDVSDDGLVYTFTLHEDSQYADGSPLTAADFAYGWLRLADPTLAGPYQYIGCGVIAGYAAYAVTSCPDAEGDVRDPADLDDLDLDVLREAVGVTALDDRTLAITLAQPTPWFLSMAALWVGAPVRQQDVEQGGAMWWSDPATYVGNGPFQLDEWHGGRLTWTVNESWPLGPLQLDSIEMQIIESSQTAFQAYQNGELDILEVQAEDWDAVARDDTLRAQVLLDAPQTSNYLAFNLRTAPFDDVRVRQALAQAFDRETYVQDLLGGMGMPSASLIPPSIPGHIDTPGWSFDPDAARAALAEAGYPNGVDFPEVVLPFPASPITQQEYEWIASQWQDHLNITVQLDPLDATAYIELISSPETFPQLVITGWNPDYPDPQNYYAQMFATGGYEAVILGYTNAEFDALVTAADRETDAGQRSALYAEAHAILLTDIPVTFLWYSQDRLLVQPHVQGLSEAILTPLDIDGIPGFYGLEQLSVSASE